MAAATDTLRALFLRESTHYPYSLDYLQQQKQEQQQEEQESVHGTAEQQENVGTAINNPATGTETAAGGGGATTRRTKTSSGSQETSYSRSGSGSGSGSSQLNETWRRKICEWSYEVVDHFGYDREVVSIALNFLDRYVASCYYSPSSSSNNEKRVSRKDFQLIALTSLYLAIKVHGEMDGTHFGEKRRVRVEKFAELGRGRFSVEAVETMEMNMLMKLQWRANPPTAIQFIWNMLYFLPDHDVPTTTATHSEYPGDPYQYPYNYNNSNSNIIYANDRFSLFDLARYLAEISVCVSVLALRYKPSIIAYASILNAMEAMMIIPPLSNTSTSTTSTSTSTSALLTFALSKQQQQQYSTFFLNIQTLTGLTIDCEDIRTVRSILTDICPNLIELTSFAHTTTKTAQDNQGIEDDSLESFHDSPRGVDAIPMDHPLYYYQQQHQHHHHHAVGGVVVGGVGKVSPDSIMDTGKEQNLTKQQQQQRKRSNSAVYEPSR